ncbi:MAG: LPXTG cell wall anchor domain-containing protein [Candidatus Poseidoniales archaeon]|jgi:hypothetical protein|nr:LPXTG cell wall anchor domain-containing protein [Candidatus Poseidoniales archaeon]
MRNMTALVLVIIIFLSPIADAHGANTFQFIMRNESIQPDDAQVSQNDSLGFNNVVTDLERTIKLDNPNNSTHNWSCTASQLNNSGIDDECWLWLDPLNWSSGEYVALVYSNGTLWKTVNITIVTDLHNETTPTFVLPGGDIGQETLENENDIRPLLAGILLLGGAFYLTTKRRRNPVSSKDDNIGEHHD